MIAIGFRRIYPEFENEKFEQVRNADLICIFKTRRTILLHNKRKLYVLKGGWLRVRLA